MLYNDGAFPFWLPPTSDANSDGAFPIYNVATRPYYRYGAVPIDTTPAQGKPLTQIFFNLRGRSTKVRDVDNDEPHVEFCLFKCRMSDLLQLLSKDEVNGSRFKVKVLNDTDGDYGGDKESPYGWIKINVDSS